MFRGAAEREEPPRTPRCDWRQDNSAAASVPRSHLELEWSYGLSISIGGSLFETGDGEVVFPAAAAVVVFRPSSRTQRFFCGHDAAVTSLAVHRASGCAMSVQRFARKPGDLPHCCVWRICDQQELVRLSGFGQEGGFAAFSSSGSHAYIAGADDAGAWQLSLWQLPSILDGAMSRESILSSVSRAFGGNCHVEVQEPLHKIPLALREGVRGLQVHPEKSSLVLVHGKQTLTFVSIPSLESDADVRQGLGRETLDLPSGVSCARFISCGVAYGAGVVYAAVGTVDGRLILFGESDSGGWRAVSSLWIAPHSGPGCSVEFIRPTPLGFVVGGSASFGLTFYGHSMETLCERLPLTREDGNLADVVDAAYIESGDGGALLLATSDGGLLRVAEPFKSFEDECLVAVSVVDSHGVGCPPSADEPAAADVDCAILALAAHPSMPTRVAVGDAAGRVFIYDTGNHRAVQMATPYKCETSLCCLCYAPSGVFLLAGLADGTLEVISTLEWSDIFAGAGGSAGKTVAQDDFLDSVEFNSIMSELRADLSIEVVETIWLMASSSPDKGKVHRHQLAGLMQTEPVAALLRSSQGLAPPPAFSGSVSVCRSGAAVTAMEFAPISGGQAHLLAVATADGAVALLSCTVGTPRIGVNPEAGFVQLRVLRGGSSAVLAIQFSTCGQYLAMSSRDAPLVVWEVEADRKLDESEINDQEWFRTAPRVLEPGTEGCPAHQWKLPVGAAVAGLYEQDRPNPGLLVQSARQHDVCVVSGGRFDIGLYAFPVPSTRAVGYHYRQHGGPSICACWTGHDRLLTAGLRASPLLQWRFASELLESSPAKGSPAKSGRRGSIEEAPPLARAVGAQPRPVSSRPASTPRGPAPNVLQGEPGRAAADAPKGPPLKAPLDQGRTANCERRDSSRTDRARGLGLAPRAGSAAASSQRRLPSSTSSQSASPSKHSSSPSKRTSQRSGSQPMPRSGQMGEGAGDGAAQLDEEAKLPPAGIAGPCTQSQPLLTLRSVPLPLRASSPSLESPSRRLAASAVQLSLPPELQGALNALAAAAAVSPQTPDSLQRGVLQRFVSSPCHLRAPSPTSPSIVTLASGTSVASLAGVDGVRAHSPILPHSMAVATGTSAAALSGAPRRFVSSPCHLRAPSPTSPRIVTLAPGTSVASLAGVDGARVQSPISPSSVPLAKGTSAAALSVADVARAQSPMSPLFVALAMGTSAAALAGIGGARSPSPTFVGCVRAASPTSPLGAPTEVVTSLQTSALEVAASAASLTGITSASSGCRAPSPVSNRVVVVRRVSMPQPGAISVQPLVVATAPSAAAAAAAAAPSAASAPSAVPAVRVLGAAHSGPSLPTAGAASASSSSPLAPAGLRPSVSAMQLPMRKFVEASESASRLAPSSLVPPSPPLLSHGGGAAPSLGATASATALLSPRPGTHSDVGAGHAASAGMLGVRGLASSMQVLPSPRLLAQDARSASAALLSARGRPGAGAAAQVNASSSSACLAATSERVFIEFLDDGCEVVQARVLSRRPDFEDGSGRGLTHELEYLSGRAGRQWVCLDEKKQLLREGAERDACPYELKVLAVPGAPSWSGGGGSSSSSRSRSSVTGGASAAVPAARRACTPLAPVGSSVGGGSAALPVALSSASASASASAVAAAQGVWRQSSGQPPGRPISSSCSPSPGLRGRGALFPCLGQPQHRVSGYMLPMNGAATASASASMGVMPSSALLYGAGPARFVTLPSASVAASVVPSSANPMATPRAGAQTRATSVRSVK